MTPSQKLTQSMFDAACKDAYITGGLKGFVKVAELYDPSTTIGFSTLLAYATRYYGVVKTEIAQEVGVAKSSMSNWCNPRVQPPAPYTRERVYNAVMRHLKVQLPVEP